MKETQGLRKLRAEKEGIKTISTWLSKRGLIGRPEIAIAVYPYSKTGTMCYSNDNPSTADGTKDPKSLPHSAAHNVTCVKKASLNSVLGRILIVQV